MAPASGESPVYSDPPAGWLGFALIDSADRRAWAEHVLKFDHDPAARREAGREIMALTEEEFRLDHAR